MPDVSVFESVAITESIVPSNVSYIGVDSFVTITEFVDRTDGLLKIISNIIDFSGVSEYVVLRTIHRISVGDSIVAFDEDSQTFAELTVGRAVSGYDSIGITENVNIGRTPLSINRYEEITMAENIVLGLDPFNMQVFYDEIGIIEIIFLSLEIDLSFDDFLRSYPYIEETGFNILTQVFENGSEQRRDKWGRSKKRYSIVFSPRPKSEIDEIRAFYVTKSASAIAFNFTNPLDNQVYLVRFEGNSLRVDRVAHQIYQATVTVVEVFA